MPPISEKNFIKKGKSLQEGGLGQISQKKTRNNKVIWVIA
jgi:hypothetical protein